MDKEQQDFCLAAGLLLSLLGMFGFFIYKMAQLSTIAKGAM